MVSFTKIRTVALYEIKTLMRSWFFRIFSLLAFGILVFLNTVFFASQQTSIWTLRAIPSSIPYMNLLLLNIVQAVIGIFMASDFLKYDRKLDTTEVIYVRSMTNVDYVLGKSLGIFLVFLFLNMLVLFISMIFNVSLLPPSYQRTDAYFHIWSLVLMYGTFPKSVDNIYSASRVYCQHPVFPW